MKSFKLSTIDLQLWASCNFLEWHFLESPEVVLPLKIGKAGKAATILAKVVHT